VLELEPAANFGSRAWAGQKVLWVLAPPAPGGLVVTGRRLDAPGQVRFDDGALPGVRLALPAPEPRRWVDRPGYTRLRRGGCYAYTVIGNRSRWVVVFRAVKIAHWGRRGDTVAGRSAETMERALVEPRGRTPLAVPSEANCRAPSAAEAASSPFGRSSRVFSCSITDQAGTARYDVQFLHDGCYVAERRRSPHRHTRGILACR
jgi:hypothetical protein